MGVSPEVMQRVKARLGTVLNGKWRLERVLGVGGMAAVYLAVHRNQKRAAVKMLHPEHAVDASVRNRFLREGYAANTVSHPGAVTVYDDDVTPDGAAFLVMELLEGETLEDRADRKGARLPLSEVLALADQLLDVLAAAHDKDIVHRDIKPENLFLTTEGQLKVLDFGIARLREPSADKDTTAIGSFMGTPAFMAPEQARGRWEDVDGRTDLWAVGGTLFTLISGEHVHEAETINDQLVLSATTRARSISTLVPTVPSAIAVLIDRALAFEKAERWPSARAMQTALRDAARSLPAEDQPAPSVRTSVMYGRTQSAIAATVAAPTAHTDDTGVISAFTDSGLGSARARRRTRWAIAAVLGLVGTAAIVIAAARERQRAISEEANDREDVVARERVYAGPASSAVPAPIDPPPAEQTSGSIAPPAMSPGGVRALKPLPTPRPAANPKSSHVDASPAASSPSPHNPFDRRY
jgi:serine/threonine-protein kinase